MKCEELAIEIIYTRKMLINNYLEDDDNDY